MCSEFYHYLLVCNLKSSNVDVVNGSSCKFAIKLFSSKGFQIMEKKLPQLKDIVSGELGPPLHNDRPRSQELSLDGGPEADWARPHNQHPVPLAVEAVAAVQFVPRLLLQNLEDFLILER